MRVVSERVGTGSRIFTARTDDGHAFEFVDGGVHDGRWVVMLSTLVGCPVRCIMCDAGGGYEGRLTREELVDQLDHVVRGRYPDGQLREPLDVQLTRMGDPAFNPAVLEALRVWGPNQLLKVWVSTVAPASTAGWFDELLQVRDSAWAERLRLQFSIHATSEEARQRVVPVRCWSFAQMAEYGRRFHRSRLPKITLNFAVSRGEQLDPATLSAVFDPSVFAVKLSALNPTRAAGVAGLISQLDPSNPQGARELTARFEASGYETTVELPEGDVDATCGMHVSERPEGRPRPRRTLQRD